METTSASKTAGRMGVALRGGPRGQILWGQVVLGQREATTNNEKRCLRGRRGYSEYPWGACQIFPADATCGDTMPLMPRPRPLRDCKPASPFDLSGDRKFTPACN